METSAVGFEFNTTVKVAVPPDSVVSPLMADTVTPTLSLSTFVTDTSFASKPWRADRYHGGQHLNAVRDVAIIDVVVLPAHRDGLGLGSSSAA
ncbi:MAG: hypothetical protein R3C59_14670 [Planctomycetaceae bacterium]